jgi:uncharacterized membrane protein
MSDTAFTFSAGKWTIDKDPDAELDYVLKMAPWLDKIPDTFSLTVPAVIVAAVGVTAMSATYVGKTIVIWVHGGTAGSTGSVTIRFTTAGGRVDDRTVYFKVRQR